MRTIMGDVKELYDQIVQIVHNYHISPQSLGPPDEYSREMWQSCSLPQKAFYLIDEIVLSAETGNYLRMQQEKPKKAASDVKTAQLSLGNGPRFWSHGDEEMFFAALKTMASYQDVIGSGKTLTLVYLEPMSREEKQFLVGLLRRYQMKVPGELRKQSTV